MRSKDFRELLHATLIIHVGMIGLCCSSFSHAQEDVTEGSVPLTVRDAGVYLLSAYGTDLNDRALFQSTLPGYTLSRRPSASRKDANTPCPVSMMTFSGPPTEDVDVMLEFDNGRFLSHWPPARMRSKRLLWSGLSLSVDAPEVPARMSDDHWLSPLRDNARLYAATRGRCDRALLYDAELKFAPHVTLERAEANFRVKNSGGFPVHDVFVYRPTDDGRWNVWTVDTVDRSSKALDAEEQEDAEEQAGAPEEIFDAADETATTVEGEATDGEDPQPERSGDSTDGQEARAAEEPKTGLAAFVDKIKSGELPSTGDGGEKTDDGAVTVDATDLGAISSAEILQSWTQRLHELGLGDAEARHLSTILQTHALQSDSTMLVYRMDEAHLEKLLPLEVTPYPDRLFRVALVIVQDADPDLQSQIDGLVKQLGNEEWSQRVAAQEALDELGLAAKPKLEEALKSEDAEVVFRAEQLLEKIQSKP